MGFETRVADLREDQASHELFIKSPFWVAPKDWISCKTWLMCIAQHYWRTESTFLEFHLSLDTCLNLKKSKNLAQHALKLLTHWRYVCTVCEQTFFLIKLNKSRLQSALIDASLRYFEEASSDKTLDSKRIVSQKRCNVSNQVQPTIDE